MSLLDVLKSVLAFSKADVHKTTFGTDSSESSLNRPILHLTFRVTMYTVCSKVDCTDVEGRVVDSGVVHPRFIQETEVCVQSV